MDRKTFFKQLDQRIFFSNDEERKLCINYYDELIDEFVNAGISEKEAILKLNVDEIVEQYKINLNASKSEKEINKYFKKTDIHFSKIITYISLIFLFAFTVTFFIVIYFKQGNLDYKQSYGAEMTLRLAIAGLTWIFLFGYYVYFIWRFIKKKRLYDRLITISHIFLMVAIYLTLVVGFSLLVFCVYLKLSFMNFIFLTLILVLVPYIVLLIKNLKGSKL